MIFIGDCHGQFDIYKSILDNYKNDFSIQLGDMGIGFITRSSNYNKKGRSYSPELSKNHMFIRGNHDSPSLCDNHPNYLGDYGYRKKSDLFYISGGYSVLFDFE